LQAATDPAFLNKWPVSPLPRIPTNLGENILGNYLEKLQLASAKFFLSKMQLEEILVHVSVAPLREAEFNLKQFNQNITIPHS